MRSSCVFRVILVAPCVLVQCYRASGLNLVVAAIILWNTVYLEKAFAEVRDRQNVPDEFLTYLSPLGWDHINLTGDYVWKLDP